MKFRIMKIYEDLWRRIFIMVKNEMARKFPRWNLRKMGARHWATGGSDCSLEMAVGSLIKTMEELLTLLKNYARLNHQP